MMSARHEFYELLMFLVSVNIHSQAKLESEVSHLSRNPIMP